MRILSQLFAFLYWSKERQFLGMTVRAWLLWLPVFLVLGTLAFKWPSVVPLLAFVWFVVLVLAYIAARRLGYTRFFARGPEQPDLEFAPPHVEHRVPLRATGLFSVREREAYLVERPAEYWRVPLGQHVFMVEQGPGRFLYQIVEPSHLVRIEPGRLAFGREPQEALAVYFRATWGPEFATEPKYYYTGGEGEPVAMGEERKIYLTFSSEADRHAVWRSLLENSKAGLDVAG